MSAYVFLLCNVNFIEGGNVNRAKKLFLCIVSVFFVSNMLLLNTKASGPMDGQIIDGSLLTSEKSAFDEQPLVVEGTENGIIPYGTYLSNGVSGITDQGGGVVYISGITNCHRTSDKVQVYLYLEKLTNNGWSTIKTHSNVAYNTYKVNTGMNFLVQKAIIIGVRGAHTAKKGSTIESCTTCTSAIYIG